MRRLSLRGACRVRLLIVLAMGFVLGDPSPRSVSADPSAFREVLAEAVTMARLRETGLLALQEAYRRIESSLLQDHPELASAALYFDGLTAIELRDHAGARDHFERCAKLPCIDPELPRRAAAWSRVLQDGTLPETWQADISPWVDRIRLLGMGDTKVAAEQADTDVDGLYAALLTDSPGEFQSVATTIVPSLVLNVPDPQGRHEYDTAYQLYDPAWFTIGVLRRVHRLRMQVNVPTIEQPVLEPWVLLLSSMHDSSRLIPLAEAKPEIGPDQPIGRKELLALRLAAAERLERQNPAESLIADLQGIGIDTGDAWVLRALSLGTTGLSVLLPSAAQAVQRETAGDPFAPRWCRPRQRGDIPIIAARLAFYQEIGWAFRSRAIETDGFPLRLPASRDFLRAHEVLRSVGSLAGRVDEAPQLSAVMRWECQLRVGDWELFQNEVDGQFLESFPELRILLDSARFVAGRIRTGDGAQRTEPLATKRGELHAEIAAHLITGVAGVDATLPRRIAARETVAPAPAVVPRQGGNWGWTTVSGLLALALALLVAGLVRRRIRFGKGAGHDG